MNRFEILILCPVPQNAVEDPVDGRGSLRGIPRTVSRRSVTASCLRLACVLLALLVLLGLRVDRSQAAGASEASIAQPTAAATVILISLDGTRPADLTSRTLPSLVALGASGLRAEGLVTVNPSNTFPSHVSLATGVHPDQHRIVNNHFIDPLRGRFDRKAIHRWVEAEPIWSIAERHGIPTAAYHWVGSEGPWQGGLGPTHTRRFSSRTTEKTKVNRILSWLDLEDPAQRPRLILSWFHGADHAAHVSGPGTPAVEKALAPQDAEIRRLVRALETRDLFESTTLIFVSDHGMVGADVSVNLGRVFGRAGLDVTTLGVGGFASVVFDEGAGGESAIERAVELARARGLEAWPRAEAPADWHVADDRFGDVVVRAPIGTAIVATTTLLQGFHGYDPRAPEMAGILVARGRGVVPGTLLGRVSNLAVAPTVLCLLGLPIPEQMKGEPIPALLGRLEEAAAPTLPMLDGAAAKEVATQTLARRIDEEPLRPCRTHGAHTGNRDAAWQHEPGPGPDPGLVAHEGDPE